MNWQQQQRQDSPYGQQQYGQQRQPSTQSSFANQSLGVGLFQQSQQSQQQPQQFGVSPQMSYSTQQQMPQQLQQQSYSQLGRTTSASFQMDSSRTPSATRPQDPRAQDIQSQYMGGISGLSSSTATSAASAQLNLATLLGQITGARAQQTQQQMPQQMGQQPQQQLGAAGLGALASLPQLQQLLALQQQQQQQQQQPQQVASSQTSGGYGQYSQYGLQSGLSAQQQLASQITPQQQQLLAQQLKQVAPLAQQLGAQTLATQQLGTQQRQTPTQGIPQQDYAAQLLRQQQEMVQRLQQQTQSSQVKPTQAMTSQGQQFSPPQWSTLSQQQQQHILQQQQYPSTGTASRMPMHKGPAVMDRRDMGRGGDRGRMGPPRRRTPPRSPVRRRSPPRSPSRRGRSRSPPRSPRRKRSKSPSSRSKRDRTPEREKEKKYVINLTPYSFVEVERDYLNLKRRYSKLYISEDFQKIKAPWLNTPTDITQFYNYNPIYFEYVSSKDKTETKLPASDSFQGLTRYYGKVIISTGFSELSGPGMTSSIKFLVAKEDRSDLMSIGGVWSASIDGGNPSDPQDAALMRTAARWFKEYTQVDLSTSTKWWRFMEVHYFRPPDRDCSEYYQEVSVIFVVDFSSLILPMDKFLEDWMSRQRAKRRKEKEDKKEEAKRAEEEKKDAATPPQTEPTTATATAATEQAPKSEEPKAEESTEAAASTESTTATTTPEATTAATTLSATAQTSVVEDKQAKKERKEKEAMASAPKQPGLVITSSSKPECILISLDGLLDYNESDKLEQTFEVSLFAELFYNMLQKEFGGRIFDALKAIPDAPKTEKKRRREDEEDSTTKKKKDLETKESGTATSEIKMEEADNNVSTPTQPPPTEATETSPDRTPPEPTNTTEVKMEEVKTETSESKPVEVKTETSEVKTEEKNEQLSLDLNDLPNEIKPEPKATSGDSTTEKKDDEKKEEKPKKKVDVELLRAFQFFDVNNVGYIKSEDLETLIHCLGLCQSRYYVRHLVFKVADATKTVVNYKKLVEKEE